MIYIGYFLLVLNLAGVIVNGLLFAVDLQPKNLFLMGLNMAGIWFSVMGIEHAKRIIERRRTIAKLQGEIAVANQQLEDAKLRAH